MTLHIDLNPAEEAQLCEDARQRGLTPENWAKSLLRSVLTTAAPSLPVQLEPVVDETGTFHEDRWERVLASISNGSSGRPSVPIESLRRELLYADHD